MLNLIWVDITPWTLRMLRERVRLGTIQVRFPYVMSHFFLTV